MFDSLSSIAPRVPCALFVGGLDPSGSAGVLIDAAAARSVCVHPAAVVAVATVQDGRSFVDAVPQDAALVARSMEVALAGQDVRALKTGALGSADNVLAVALAARGRGSLPLVVDPVIRSSTGGELFCEAAATALAEELLPLASLVTPNLAESAWLANEPIAHDVFSMRRTAKRILGRGARAVLVKGGHLEGGEAVDLFLDARGREQILRSPKLPGGDVRGTGCALAALVAAYLARGQELGGAIESAKNRLRFALENARVVGPGPRVLGFFETGVEGHGLTPPQRHALIELERRRVTNATEHTALSLRQIEKRDDPGIARVIREVMPEFGADGPGFAMNDPEVAAMAKAYGPPRSLYFVLERSGEIFGGGGFAPLEGGPDGVCELKKMYFLKQARGLGMGRALLFCILEAARQAGYKKCYIETLARMAGARRLYESCGFVPRSQPLGATEHFGCDCWYEREL